jgi:UDP-2,3-diacylglucosamine pyrophosphatase LpxH
MADPVDIVIVSDLHLGPQPSGHAGPQGAEAGALALRALIDRKTSDAAASARPWGLVLLGDLFDFARAPASTGAGVDAERVAAARARTLLDDHPRLVEAIGAALASGADVAVVSGNRDMAWWWPAVRRELHDRVASDTGALTFHPWILYVPGLLYAEHGSQHHDINSHPRPMQLAAAPGAHLGVAIDDYLAAFGRRLGAETSPAGIGSALSLMRRRPAAAIRAWSLHVDLVMTLARGLVRLSSRREARRRRRYRRRALASASGEIGLPPDVLAELDALTEVRVWPMLSRLARAVADPSQRGTAYLHTGARRVQRTLAAHGLAVPVYAFGHTHVAERWQLDAATGGWYLNPGAWTDAPGSHTYVEVRRASDGAVTSQLRTLSWPVADAGPATALTPP